MPLQLTWGSPCIPRQIGDYGGGIIDPPNPLRIDKWAIEQNSSYRVAVIQVKVAGVARLYTLVCLL